jgi:hypothetical protein
VKPLLSTALSLVAMLVAVLALPPGGADAATPAAVGPLGRPGVDVIAQRGFGDRRNSYAWSMAWFKGRLYVGTARSQVCVENQTLDFYFPRRPLIGLPRFYQPNPEPLVHCPKNPWDMDLRAEIWQYTPRTGTWRCVYRSPADIPNPRARGKFLPRDIAFRGMTVYRDSRGDEALYVGGVTADEYVPEIARKHPPRLLRTLDGKRFHNIGAPRMVKRSGLFRSMPPIGFRGLLVWKNRLLVTASPGLTGDGAMYAVARPWTRRARFTQVSPRSMHVFEMEKFNEALYAGVGDSRTGYSVWKLRDLRRPFGFKPIVTNGAGRGRAITSVVSMRVFQRRLYVGAVGWFTDEVVPGAELIRIASNGKWNVVTGYTRTTADGRVRAPISGLGDGFENIFNAHFWRMAEWGDTLHLGTLDWSWLVQQNKTWGQNHYGNFSGLASSILAGELGFDIWASCDGRDWFPITRTAFGGSMYDFGARTFVPSRAGLFIGSANHAQGTTIWNDRASACSSLVRRSAQAAGRPLPPKRVLTDAQRRGTVVSWVPAAGAARYRVLRAQYLQFPLSFLTPPALPGGFRLEGQVPIPVPQGTPGSSQTDIPVRGPFVPVGSTSSAYFVDRSRRAGGRYAYQVVAESASGAVSAASNAQVVPDPRPPATFESVRKALGAAGAALAGDARAKWRRGDRGASLAALARLRQVVGRDEDLRELVYRLERRLRYRHAAGGR